MRKVLMTALGLALVVPTGAVAQQRGMRRPMRAASQQMGPPRGVPGPGMGRVYSARALLNQRSTLELSEEQVTQLEAIATQLRATHETVADVMREHAGALRDAMGQDRPDPSVVETHARELAAARQQVEVATAVASARAKAMLNDEQRGRVLGWMEGRGMRQRGMPGMSGRGQRPMRRSRRFN
ncbi:MAG TPA: Spy/CpxP family protein refolding chaperone [Gemmatimonadales bacterium]